jgi:hypothetical protein
LSIGRVSEVLSWIQLMLPQVPFDVIGKLGGGRCRDHL